MITLVYAAVAIAFLILVLGLFRKARPDEPDEATVGIPDTPSTGSAPWLHFSERIFDPSDTQWLREELAFPKLAEVLIEERKLLAIRWLGALQASFDELVRTPDLTLSGDSADDSAGSWHLLWLTLRFKFLVSYALVVVKLFGPYHRLVPSFSWYRFSRGSERSFRRAALAGSRSSH